MSIEVVLSKAPATKPGQRTATACRAAICAFAATGILSTNIFLPSLPAIAADLRVSSAAVTSTITVFLAIFAVGQLIVGPLSDRLGQQMPILIGLCIFVLGTMWCAFAGDLLGLLIGRSIQAAGACTFAVLSRAIARDLFDGQALAKTMASITIATAAAPGFSPSSAARLIIFSAGAPNLPLSRFSQSAPGRRMRIRRRNQGRLRIPCIRSASPVAIWACFETRGSPHLPGPRVC